MGIFIYPCLDLWWIALSTTCSASFLVHSLSIHHLNPYLLANTPRERRHFTSVLRRCHPDKTLSKRKCQQNDGNDEIHLFEEGISTKEEKEDVNFGLYVHIPYCRRRCHYCDFAIVPIGSNTSTDPIHTNNHENQVGRKTNGFQNLNTQYKNAILDEISLIHASSGSEKISVRSIYFGGGTPSLAPIDTLKEIMSALIEGDDAPFYLDNEAEVTIEMDPGTFDISHLTAIRDMGFNRISLGVQSFDDNLLESMGRVHRSKDIYDSIEMIQLVFGNDANYSMDLISGVPGLTIAMWTETLYKAVMLHPKPRHLSVYDLQVEEGTAFWKWYKDDSREVESFETAARSTMARHNTRKFSLPSTDDCAFMYRYASGYLRSKDYEHYEISSYAYAKGSPVSCHRSKHNQIYWEVGGQWYALGLGATSCIGGFRFARPRALSDYVSWVDGLISEHSNTVLRADRESNGEMKWNPPWKSSTANDIDQNDALLDIVMTRLRTSDGLDLDFIAEHYGKANASSILKGFDLALDSGLGKRVQHTDASGEYQNDYGRIMLKDPDGFLFSNNIISNIFVELDNE